MNKEHLGEAFKSIIHRSLWIVLVAVGAALYYHYSDYGLVFHYNILNVELPADANLGGGTARGTISENLSLMRVVVHSARPVISVSYLKVRGVKDIAGFAAKLYGNTGDTSDTPGRRPTILMDNTTGTLTMTGFEDLPSSKRLVVFLWGTFGDMQHVEMKTGESVYTATKAALVGGVELFFARYWRLCGFMLAVLLLFTYYRYRLLQGESLELKSRSKRSTKR